MDTDKYDLVSPFCNPGVGDQQANRLWDELKSEKQKNSALLAKLAAYEALFDEIYRDLKYTMEIDVPSAVGYTLSMLDELRPFREKSIVQS